ncbi:MAG TPA: hypothetical protein VGM84_19440 [Steroidobacteraceae bacterium]|jgi:hypothetical protein
MTGSRLIRKVPVALSIAFTGLACTGMAHAACTIPDLIRDAAGHLTPATYRYNDDDDRQTAIVGLWKFEMLAKSTSSNKNPMPDGTLVDFGTQAWHSDGTELLNSGIRNPADGDFCQGVWEQTGPSTFKLNHLPLAWMGGVYLGPVHLTMVVTVDRSRNRFSGWFSETVFQATTTPGHEFDDNSPIVTITGNITASRMTP